MEGALISFNYVTLSVGVILSVPPRTGTGGVWGAEKEGNGDGRCLIRLKRTLKHQFWQNLQ